MADTVQPIREGIEPKLDIQREMLTFAAEKIAEYTKEQGYPPESIALVLIGPPSGETRTSAYSWTPSDDERRRLHVCSVASMVLTKRALGL